jgi:fructokinase
MTTETSVRLGIDLGGTKTEITALNADGVELLRERVATDRSSYSAVLNTIVGLVTRAEAKLGQRGTIGIGIPGTISAKTRLVKNANSTVLNGHALDQDLGRILGRDVRCMNDANCLALSEAVDGAGAGYRVVFAVILGTGCGAAIAVNGRPWAGPNRLAGEWGHNPLPWMTATEFPGPVCWCGKMGCIETWISGIGFAADYVRGVGELTSAQPTAREVVALARGGDTLAGAALGRYAGRLARSLAHVINVLDPNVIVLGGGMSNVDELYELVPPQLERYVFGREVQTPIVRSKHGDSSGVRGAARLWPKESN